MNYIDLNKQALEALYKGNFTLAQNLFYENAKSLPSHETYNNLGWYLYTEGLCCKNDKVRNAEKLAMHYLLKAKSLKLTSINLNNIANVLEGQRNYTCCGTGVENVELSYAAYQNTDLAVTLKYSDEAEYNRLRFLYLCDMQNVDVLLGLKVLIEKFNDIDCIEFWLNVLCIHEQFDECLKTVEQYQKDFNEMSLFLIYYLCGEYKKASDFIEDVIKKFSLHFVHKAMIIDCLEKSGNSQKVIDVKCLLTSEYIDDNKKVPKELNQLFDNENYRTELTKSYRYKPPFITLCGYFGCRKHQTPFFEDQI